MRASAEHALTTALTITTLVTLARIILLPFYQTALGPDEAQYWFWGQDFDWGYYSKPPVIGWLIGSSTALLGDNPWSVRLASPILIAMAGLFLFGAARRLYGAGAALWTLILWHLLPAVMLGATIITTDVPLLACWSGALYALVRLTEADAKVWPWATALGIAIGLGLLSKYAMIYWPLGLGVALILTPRARRAGFAPLGCAVIIGALIFLPNVLWNVANELQTVGHTADNADWRGGLQWGELGQFLGDQFGVAGPLIFLVFLVWLSIGPRREAERLLIGFAIVPLAVICLQAVLSRAHANWAMAAYPAIVILLPGWLQAGRKRWVLWGSAGLHTAVGVLFTAALLNFALADALGLSNAVKRVRGWEETTLQVREAFIAGDYDRLLLDDRELAAHLVWELRGDAVDIAVLDPDGRFDNTYEMALPYQRRSRERLLLVTSNDVTRSGYDRFDTMIPVGEIFVDLKSTRRGRPERTLDLWSVSESSEP